VSPVPTYALYGESDHQETLHLMHCESIAARGSRHGWRIRPHQHDALFQLLHVRDGGGVTELEGEDSELGPGSVVVVPPLSIHGYVFQSGTVGWVVSVPEGNIRELIQTLAAGLWRPRHLQLTPGGQPAADVDALFAGLAREYEGRGRGRAQALRAMLSLLLVAVSRELDEKDAPSIGNRQRTHVQRFRGMIERSYRAPRTIRDYAGRLGISTTQLNRLCRRASGRSALELLHDRILLEAKRDLIYTTLDISQVAYALGFRDPAYFSRFFAARTGCAPTVFRRRNKHHMPVEED